MDTTLINTKVDLPIWKGLDTPLYVTDIMQETHGGGAQTAHEYGREVGKGLNVS